ncbi:MAG: BRCT domain-containing protein [Deltaproteobacteria bacterium]|nr:BRCT domain-containing protein [Deltaproteobacteria bacterium]
MSTYFDPDGQPLPGFHQKNRESRSLDELIGVCKGVLADDQLVKEEALFLNNWFKANPEAAQVWPGKELLARLTTAFADGYLDQEELDDLKDLTRQMIGDAQSGQPAPFNRSSSLMLEKLDEPIVFKDNLFCFTGAMAYGPRKVVQDLVLAQGGLVANSVLVKLNYLVVGYIASRDWKHTTHGNKILLAMDYKERLGKNIKIISEEDFLKYAIQE